MCVRGCWGQGGLLYLTLAILSASLFPQTFCFLLKWPFCISLPSLLLWTKPCPGDRLLPALLPLCPLPLLHQRGISFALQGEPLTFREHMVAEFPEMRCPGLCYSLIVVSSFPVFSLVRPLLYLHYACSRFRGSCNMQRIQVVTSGWAHIHIKYILLAFCDLLPLGLFASPSHFGFMADTN